MKNVVSLTCLILLAAAATVASTLASADPGHPGRHRAVFAACAAANGITLPAKGSGQALSAGDETAMRSCVAGFRASVQSCAANAGIPKPAPGSHPELTTDQKAALQQCRTEALAQITAK